MNAFIKVCEIDVSKMVSDLLSHEYMWSEYTGRQDYPGSAHADTESIYLRWSKEMSIDTVFTDLDAVDYTAMLDMPSFRSAIASIVSAVGGSRLGRAMIVKLKPDGFITPHADEGLYADTYERFHLPLVSKLGNYFTVEHDGHRHTEVVEMLPGELWWFDHKKVHSVDNASGEDRIHLIVDIVAEKYKQPRISRKMKFQRETAGEVWEDMQPLLKMHYDEIAHYKDIKFNPDKEFYMNAEESGSLRVLTVREGLELIGYSVFLLKHNPHYKESLQALQDVVFIRKDKRGQGREFLQWCDNQLKSEGVEAVYHHVKAAFNWGPMLERQGYELIDHVYGKRL